MGEERLGPEDGTKATTHADLAPFRRLSLWQTRLPFFAETQFVKLGKRLPSLAERMDESTVDTKESLYYRIEVLIVSLSGAKTVQVTPNRAFK